jgi:hypothetical protein
MANKPESVKAQETIKKVQPAVRNTPGINQPTVNKAYKNTTNSSNYFGNVGRELRDVPTALATGFVAMFERKQGAQPGSKRLQELVDNDTRAGWNARRQYKEAINSITGKRGTRSDQIQGGKYVNKTPKKK